MKKIIFLGFLFCYCGVFSQISYVDTKGQLEVSNAGTASYNLALELPPSIKDFAPEISLTYTSGVRGGIAGQGWNINNISCISRIGTRQDIDGYRDAVDFDTDDKLALDGQRLLLKPGTGEYWADGSMYLTEYKSNLKIELKVESSTYGPQTYFIVTYPNGSRNWYGSTGNGVIQNATSVNAWYIIRSDDAYGNFITYNYVNYSYAGTNQLYIDNIKFSGNEAIGLQQVNQIKFNYRSGNSKRIEKDYIKGGAVYSFKILNNIEVLSSGALYRKYQLTHSTELLTDYERLTQIQIFNQQGEAANPVTFQYNTSDYELIRKEKPYLNTLNFQNVELAGDFDGDGRLDFVADNMIYSNLFNDAVGNLPVPIPTNSTMKFVATTMTNNKLNQFQSIVIVDPIADGLTFKIYNFNGSSVSLAYTKTVHIGTPTPTLGRPYSQSKLYAGDFNGDGITEVLIHSTPTVYDPSEYTWADECWWLNTCGFSNLYDNYRVLDLNPNSSTTLGTPGLTKGGFNIASLGPIGEKYVADFNGDGKSDIIVFNGTNYSVKGYKQSPMAPYNVLETIGYGTIDEYSPTKQLLFGDYNGDGKTDIMMPDTEGDKDHTYWHIYYANPNPSATNMFTKESWIIAEYWPDTGNYYNNQRHFSNYYALDINGDGKSDFVRVWRKYFKEEWTINDHNTEWSVTGYTNNIGRSSNPGFTASYYTAASSDSPDLPVPIASRYNYHDLNTDLVFVRGKNYKIEYYSFKKDFDMDNRLSLITEANGNITHKINYAPMMAGSQGLGDSAIDFYSSSNSAIYPDIEIIKNPHNYLVYKVTTTVNGIPKYQDFKYRSFISNFNYGTIGFQRTSRTGWYKSINDSKVWTTEANDISLRGANVKTWTSYNPATVFATVPTNVYSSTTKNFSAYTEPFTKVYNILLNQQTTTDYVSGTQTDATYQYDGSVDSPSAFGLQTQEEVKYYKSTTLQGTKITKVDAADYESNPTGVGNNYYIGRIKKQTDTKSIAAAGDTRSSETKYTYTGKNVTQIEKRGHLTDPLIEEMSYDAVGNVLSVKTSMPTSVPAVADRTTTDVYDSNKRFVISKTDHYGFVSTFEYDNSGNIKKSIDHLGIRTDFLYDNWNKMTQSTTTNLSATPLVTTFTFNRLSDGSSTVTSLNSVGDNVKEVKKYDVLGQLTQTTTKGFASNSLISKNIEYDILGRKTRESEPYFTTPSKWTIFEYGAINRINKIIFPSTRVQLIEYIGLETKTTDDGKIYKVLLDALGNKVQTTDPGGTIDYTYYATGQLKESNYDGHKVTNTIDGWGRKISTFDPNGGDTSYNYEYDGFGQLRKETTPKGYTQYTYDDDGKLTNKKVSGDGADYNIIYGYNGFAQLVSETATTTGGLPIDNYSYVYDNVSHKLTSSLENNAKFQHTNSITYDTFGRKEIDTNVTLEKTTNFSSTVTSKYHYNSYSGVMYKITDSNNTMLWQLNTANEKSQILTAGLGSGIAITNVYSDNFYLESQKHSLNSANILYNTYSYNAVKDQLNNRNNHVLNIYEEFSYDIQDRLERWTNPITGLQDSHVYDTRGRIITNSTLGDVTYNADATTGLYKKENIRLNASGKAYYMALNTNQTASYTMFKAPITITESSKGKIDFKYNSHLSRSCMQYDYGTISPSTARVLRKTKLYTADSSTEVLLENNNTIVKIRTFIGGDAYTAPLYNEKTINLSTGISENKNYYLHRDNLGSILAISDESGNVKEKRHFDAWGNLVKVVNASNVVLDPLNGLQFMDRGYTSHEHLQELRLINMNGRLYDPILRSFLMPDNYVEDPNNTQNYNRYSYVLNNPLKYTDVTGEFWGMGELASAAVIGAIIAATSYTLTALMADVPFSVGGLLTSTFVGAASSAVTFGVGNACSSTIFGTTAASSSSFWGSAARGVINGAITGATGTFVNAAFTGSTLNLKRVLGGIAVGGAIGGLTEGIIGGINARKNESNFWTGESDWREIKVGSGSNLIKNENLNFSDSKWKVEAEMKLKQVNQGQDNLCTYRVKQSVDDYFGVTSSNDTSWFTRANNGQMQDRFIVPTYKAYGYQVNQFQFSGKLDQTSAVWMAQEMKAGHVVQISWKPDPSSNYWHASLVSKVEQNIRTGAYRLNLMDPARWGNFNWSALKNLFSIWR